MTTRKSRVKRSNRLLRSAGLALVALALCNTSSAQLSTSELTGCLTNNNGRLQIYLQPSARIYAVTGDVGYLQRFANQLVTISAIIQPEPAASAARAIKIDKVRVVSESCTSVLNAKHPTAITGKAGPTSDEFPVTTTASAAENTPGYQTEAAHKQEQGSSGIHAALRPPNAPMQSEQAGQSPIQAEQNAVAASRAEMYPGTSLGVDAK